MRLWLRTALGVGDDDDDDLAEADTTAAEACGSAAASSSRAFSIDFGLSAVSVESEPESSLGGLSPPLLDLSVLLLSRSEPTLEAIGDFDPFIPLVRPPPPRRTFTVFFAFFLPALPRGECARRPRAEEAEGDDDEEDDDEEEEEDRELSARCTEMSMLV
jgi:hypothetical protein